VTRGKRASAFRGERVGLRVSAGYSFEPQASLEGQHDFSDYFVFAEVTMDATKPFFHLACTLVLLGMLTGALPATAQQSTTTSETTDTATARLPDSPGAVLSYSNDEKNDSIVVLAQSQSDPGSPPQPQATAPQKPVGTAAAEAPNTNAIAASQPAGVAIAPAKQHRVRTIVIRTGAIIGAGIAIGAVVALTAATPPKPPGAH
jgi:hypothetical protein